MDQFFIGEMLNTSGCQFKTMFTVDTLIVSYTHNGIEKHNFTQFSSVWLGSTYLVTVLYDNVIATADRRGNYSCKITYTYNNTDTSIYSDETYLDIRGKNVKDYISSHIDFVISQWKTKDIQNF